MRDRNVEYEPPDGIVVTIHGFLGEHEHVTQPNVVRSVYRDPDLNPPSVSDPFDFTFGGDCRPDLGERRQFGIGVGRIYEPF